MRTAALFLSLLFIANTVSAHRGGYDEYGCHHDRVHGGYHCHRGSLAGKFFVSQEEMLARVPTATAKRQPEKDTARVVRVLDGDTVEILLNGQQDKVRLLRINTPEMTDRRPQVLALAQAAKHVLESLVLDKPVSLTYDVVRRDKYRRLLAHLYLDDGTWINREMVRLGYAQIMTIPPNVKYTAEIREAQQEAKDKKRGLWAD